MLVLGSNVDSRDAANMQGWTFLELVTTSSLQEAVYRNLKKGKVLCRDDGVVPTASSVSLI